MQKLSSSKLVIEKLGRDDWLVFWLFFQSNWKTKYLLPKWHFHFFQLNIWLFCISFQYTYLKKLLELIENTYENAYDFSNTSYFINFCDEILFDKNLWLQKFEYLHSTEYCSNAQTWCIKPNFAKTDQINIFFALINEIQPCKLSLK